MLRAGAQSCTCSLISLTKPACNAAAWGAYSFRKSALMHVLLYRHSLHRRFLHWRFLRMPSAEG